MTRDELKEKANDLPLVPGVYLMMDKTGRVIYVGKAKKLKNRVSQYFQDTASHSPKTRLMVSHIDHFDVIAASSEFEALILECSLIKRYLRQPPHDQSAVDCHPGGAEAAGLLPAVSEGDRQGEALPELSHEPLRGLVSAIEIRR